MHSQALGVSPVLCHLHVYYCPEMLRRLFRRYAAGSGRVQGRRATRVSGAEPCLGGLLRISRIARPGPIFRSHPRGHRLEDASPDDP
ncbi:hypothetical protein C8Q77DRAFT_1139972 [Trametes polyzona]|nr:hypothetical protein C8Q77DRAFT_1139972 [Trametes polyzona]